MCSNPSSLLSSFTALFGSRVLYSVLTSSVLLSSVLLACSEIGLLRGSDSSTTCGAQGCFGGDTGVGGSSMDGSPDIDGESTVPDAPASNPLCGILTCNPDDIKAQKCNASKPDAGGEDDASSDAPFDDQSAPDAGDTEHKDSEAGDADSDAGDPNAGCSDSGYMSGSMGGDPGVEQLTPFDLAADAGLEPDLSCQVASSDDGRATVCMPSGSGVDNDPCVTSADCRPGTACVGDENMGVCRAYCCFSADACDQGTYCAVQQSRDELLKNPDEQFLVPVCVPASDCELLPGPEGTNRCADGLTCSVVRTDGTTACVLPGTAVAGEPCGTSDPGQSPCAEGFVCSKNTNTCHVLCRVTEPGGCGDGVCQGGTRGIPEPYGVCVAP